MPDSLPLQDSNRTAKVTPHPQNYKISLIKALTHRDKSLTTAILISTRQYSPKPNKLITKQPNSFNKKTSKYLSQPNIFLTIHIDTELKYTHTQT